MPMLSSPVDYGFDHGEFWRDIPIWKSVSPDEFGDARWQQRQCITSVADVQNAFEGRLPRELVEDIRAGIARCPMQIRITPYIFSLINWSAPATDPIRRQFLPFASQLLLDHPYSEDDSLAEESDRVTPYLTHRYPDKVLFLPLNVCPVYCSFCTRSRLVGASTSSKQKISFKTSVAGWEGTFSYIRSHPEIEDVVVSGGDAMMVKANLISHIGTKLLDIPHIRRIRFATKGLSVLPMKITSDDSWIQAVRDLSEKAARSMREVVIHTHISSDHELTQWTVRAMQRLVELGIRVRNQCVLLRGVNDSFGCMYRTIKKLSYLRIDPYLVYLHDMVNGCEHLRTTLECATRLFDRLQGTTAGFNIPRFVCDTPGGGGKREIFSYVHYDRQLGVSAWTAPMVKPGKVFYYYDPIDLLPDSGRAIWADPVRQESQMEEFKDRVERQLREDAHVPNNPEAFTQFDK